MKSLKDQVLSETSIQVARSEGYRKYMYMCPAGHNTIGFGFNLDEGMSKEEASVLAFVRLRTTYDELALKAPIFLNQTSERQRVLLDMGYNMGVPTLLEFVRMWKAIKDYDFDTAADEMLDSKWHRDFLEYAEGNLERTRSFKLSLIMRTGRG